MKRSEGPGLGPWAYQGIRNVRTRAIGKGRLVTFDYSSPAPAPDVEIAMYFEDAGEARAFKAELGLRVDYLMRRHTSIDRTRVERERTAQLLDEIASPGRPRVSSFQPIQSGLTSGGGARSASAYNLLKKSSRRTRRGTHQRRHGSDRANLRVSNGDPNLRHERIEFSRDLLQNAFGPTSNHPPTSAMIDEKVSEKVQLRSKL